METSSSLLERLREQPDSLSWRRLVSLYRPLIHDWLSRQGVQFQDAEDITQDVLSVLVQELPHFNYNPERGSFRTWLRTITANRLRYFRRKGHYRPTAIGSAAFASLVNQLEDPASTMSRLWDQEHDRYIAQRLLEGIETEFEPTTWQAFQRLTRDGMKAAEVAAELNLSVNAVFIAKSRVLRRLRQAMQELTA